MDPGINLIKDFFVNKSERKYANNNNNKDSSLLENKISFITWIQSYSQHFIFFITFERAQLACVVVPVKPFQPNVM